MPPTTQTLKIVYSKIKNIWLNEKRPVSYLDFKEYSRNYMRQIFSRLRRKGLIQRYSGRTKPQFWIPVVNKESNITHGGGCISLLDILDSLCWGDPSFHDVRLGFSSLELYRLVKDASNMLSMYGFTQRKDHSIASPDILWGRLKKRKTRVVFYPTGTVIIEVLCSDDPVKIDEFSLRNFLEHLLDIRRRLLSYLYSIYKTSTIPFDELFPLPEIWIVKQLHLNRDSNIYEKVILDKVPSVTLIELVSTLRLYVKRRYIRVEAIQTPNKLLKDYIKNVLGLDMFSDDVSPTYIS
jgi:hypothetical protein